MGIKDFFKPTGPKMGIFFVLMVFFIFSQYSGNSIMTGMVIGVNQEMTEEVSKKILMSYLGAIGTYYLISCLVMFLYNKVGEYR